MRVRRFVLYGLLGLCAAAPGWAQKSKPDPRLDEAEKELEHHEEKVVKSGAQKCVDVNTVAAVELLRAVWRRTSQQTDRQLSPPHYRDIVWDYLLKIDAPYARERVKQELATNRDSAWVRQWCVELIGEWREADFGDAVQRALGDKDDAVRRAAAWALGRLRHAPAKNALQGLLKHRDALLRADARIALARLEQGEGREILVKGLEDKDGGVRCALLGALPELVPGEVVELTLTRLDDADWRVRLQAVHNLRASATREAIAGLIGLCDDERSTVLASALAALRERTGMKFRERAQWEVWWLEHQDEFDAGRAPNAKQADDGETTLVTYNGLRVVSDHVAFLIDKSGGMAATMKSSEQAKSVAALAELEQVLDKLGDEVHFNVYADNDEVTPFSKSPVPATPKNVKKALEFVAGQSETGSKDIWRLLQAVLADPEIDTAYLLSSGEPDIGQYVHWNRVTWHLADENRFRKLVVHAIAYHHEQWFRDQLEKIAETTGGEFRFVE